MAKQGYHHGDLRRALLKAADEAIEDGGVATLSMRELARRAGVSHAAPTHHFGDKKGLLTALAVDGFDQLAKALGTSRLASNSLLELGVTYVRFALERRALFEVMFRPELYHAEDPDVAAARGRAADALYAGMADLPSPAQGAARAGAASEASPDVRVAGLTAWSLVHGFTTLWLSGAFPDRDLDPASTARLIFGAAVS